MSSSKSDSGLMSSAGLIRYMDEEDQSRAIRLDPRNVLAFCLLLGFVAEVGHFLI